MSIRARVDELRRRLLDEADFARAAEYFFDEVVFAPGAERGARVKKPELAAAVRAAIAHALGESGDVRPKMMRLAKTPLVHGMVPVPGAMCAFFYFEDEDVGLVIVSRASSGRAHYARISVIPVPGAAGQAPS